MPLFARALLAHAIAAAKMDAGAGPGAAARPRAAPAHHAGVGDGRRQPRATTTRRSSTRSRARRRIVLRALVALDPKHALAPRLARGLLGERRNGQWQSTHEAAWALLALDDYRRAFEKDAPRLRRARLGRRATWPSTRRSATGMPLHRETTVPAARLLAQPDRDADVPGGRLGDALLRGAPAVRAQGPAARRRSTAGSSCGSSCGR